VTPRSRAWRGQRDGASARPRDDLNRALVPFAPLNVLKPVADGLWIVDGLEIQFGYLGAKPFPTRMTVVKLACGDLWLHSPIKPTEDLVRDLRRLGRVRFLIAPNSMHDWWLPEWQALFPRAQAFGAPGQAYSAKRGVLLQHVLSDVSPSLWAPEIGQVVVKGAALTEVGFFHRPSKTLILTDLIENFEFERLWPWWLRLLLGVIGVLDPDGKAPVDMQLSVLGRYPAVRQAVEKMIAWNPKRLIIAHGHWHPSGAVAELRRAFRWVLQP
jgi:hypothetical protein